MNATQTQPDSGCHPPASEQPHRSAMATILVRGNETGQRFAAIETQEPRRSGPPLHRHTREDELIYVLEGQVTVYLGQRQLERSAGSVVVLPRGEEHGYVVESDVARLLIVMAPAGPEVCLCDFLEEGAEPQTDQSIERLIAEAARYGVEITGPTP